MAATVDSGADIVALLECWRDFHFRRIPARRVSGEKPALAFINQVGFCTAFTAGLGVPCLREAIVGRRNPPLPEHIQHDWANSLTWRLKDVLPAQRKLYYGRAIASRPAFISLELLPAFIRLRAPRSGYRALFARGKLSTCAKRVMDALARCKQAETRQLKLASGYAQPSQRIAFDRAIKDLQEQFLILKVGERYEPFTYVWSTMADWWAPAFAQARRLRPTAAAYQIVRRYFEVAGYGSCAALARMLAIDPRPIAAALASLLKEGRLIAGPAAGLKAGTYLLSEVYAK